MGKTTKSLDIISLSKIDSIFLKDVLEKNISENININCYSVEEGLSIVKKSPVVLISGPFLKEEAMELYAGRNIIISKRILTGENFAKIMVLPKGKKVLVINFPIEVTEETIESLKEMGLNHLNYIPYTRDDVDYSDIDTAISPGHIYLCPVYIKNRIDLNRRTIAFSTFMEVLKALDLSNNNLNIFGSQYNKYMVNASWELAHLLMNVENLRMNLKGVVDKIQEGIITVDSNERISVVNSVAEEYFGFDSDNIIGMPFKKVLREYPEIVMHLERKENEEEVFLNVKGRKIMGSFTCVKTFEDKNIIFNFNNISNIQHLEESVRRQFHQKGYRAKYYFHDIDGDSPQITRSIQLAKKFASTDLAILITGESGTGKELFAQAIHNASNRADGPFIAVNFAALTDTLVESELFGYEEGTFTGALKGGKMGLFEQAHKGTIFLDEIGDTPLSVQTRLLRVLQEKEVMRIGASKVIPIDVRIIAATNEDLPVLIKEGKFRKDLYHRLKVLSLKIPPLRMRKQDIPKLIQRKIDGANFKKSISTDVKDKIIQYDWPGNVRELLNVIEFAMLVCDKSQITLDDLPPDILNLDKSEIIKDISEIKDIIGFNGQSDEYLYILKKLRQIRSSGETMGRKKLASSSLEDGFVISEEKIRTKLNKMKQLGLVDFGSTRQGSFITAKGMTLLDCWDNIGWK